MPYEIEADPGMLFSSADTIETNAEIIRKEVNNVQMLLEPIRQSFLGNSADKFFRQYDQAYEEMQQWDDIVRSFADELRTAATRLRAADNQ
jgi:WXG100 family type VII secretion target